MFKINGTRILRVFNYSTNASSVNMMTKINKKFYTEVHDRIVKFSENIYHNEMKVPLDDATYSIFYSKNDKISDMATRINGTAENIQKVEFMNLKEEIIVNENLLFHVLINTPFKVRLNGHMIIKYFPSVNMLISDTHLAEETTQMINNYNYLLYDTIQKISKKENKLQMDSIIRKNKNEVEERLNYLLSVYEKLHEEYSKAEILIEKRLKDKKSLYVNLGLLFFLAHLIVFYLLIYQIYGWDTIEPITYIVGNVYWIIGLSFFTFKKKKLDLSFFASNGYKNDYFKSMGRKIGYSGVEKDFIMNEIAEIRKFKHALLKI